MMAKAENELSPSTSCAAHATQLQKRRGGALHYNLTVVPALIVAALPKCPLCLMVYAGVLGSIGLGSSHYQRWLFTATLLSLALAIAMLALRARRHGYGPFFLGAAAALIVILSKFYIHYEPMVYIGMASLLGASIWNSWPKRKSFNNMRCQC